MSRFAGGSLLALVAALLALPAFPQTTDTPAAATAYSAPRNSLGQPDLGGLWTNASRTQLERDPQFGDRLTMTPEEAARIEGRDTSDPGSRVMSVNGQLRTSFLVEPANGRLPAMTKEAQKARTARLGNYPRGGGYGRGDNPESLTLAERCIKDFGSSSGPPMMPIGYNNTYQIVQSPTDVMILVEMVHDARVVKLTKDGRRPGTIKQWMGDSIGWYEGDTLVVETTNFRPGQAFRQAPDNLRVIEKFRRVSADQILYSFEVNNPKVFAAPIKAEVAMNATKGPLYEYACHEGNYGMGGILSGQRELDTKSAAARAAASKPARGGN